MTITFAALGIERDLTSALEASGITAPFPIQALTIPDALAGLDVCGKARTGSGKTLAFGLPAIQRLGRGGAAPKRPSALVLVPTRELASQVHEVLAPLGEVRGLHVHPCYGGANMDRQIKALRRGVDIVVATPGRLIDLVEQRAVDLSDIQIVVVDEADRMNDMGFRPQVEWLLRRCTSPHQTLLFSATLDGQIGSLVQRFMDQPVHHEVDSDEPTVESMTHRFLAVHEMDKAKMVAAIAAHQERVLVFVRTKRGAERLMRRLQDERVDVATIHGDRSQPQRERALARFIAGKVTVLVATDVAARGLHVEGIDVVVHYDPPENEKAYLHRSGRTARAGQDGLAVSLVIWNQELETKRLMNRLGLDLPIVEMFSNDPRVRDLAGWDPAGQPDQDFVRQ